MMKRSERRSTTYLPEDLLVEILSRVPAKSLTRLRSTSKRWNSLVKDGRFAKMHSANTPKYSSMVLMLTDFRVYLVSVDIQGNVTPSAKVTGPFSLKDHISKQVDVHNVFHCDGLLVCITKDNRLVVWNPCSGETRWIQARNMYSKNDYFALGYDNKSSCYKILRMHRSVEFSMYTESAEVYDFASNSWSSVGSTINWFLPPKRSRGMSVKGTTYWLAFNTHYEWFLLSFDYSTERFQSLSLPLDAPRDFDYGLTLSVTREEQQLCMLDTYRFDTVLKAHVWIATMMESTGAMSWSKFRRFHSRIMMRVLHDHKNKALLCCKYNSSEDLQNSLHIVGDDKYIQDDSPGKDSTCPLLLTYVPSLVQIQQGI